ncbi:hypothetical protein RJ639_030111 [Escallonia herrerae]|uniref:ferric-chelate reductase (NADH) n=1 Tax=Escallonia herrerae TaxID=1293975 RepID=A0AA88WZM0_9ASTE|nr:hypothetical protein RJ639_030111 [Escallonia herrerae]
MGTLSEKQKVQERGKERLRAMPMKRSPDYEGSKKAQLAIKLVWMMMPTTTFWLQWLPAIHAKTDSTYFGSQGSVSSSSSLKTLGSANILIYTLPVLFIASLSCLYLHLGKQYADQDSKSNSKNSRLVSWRRPALVKGPLGIVSRSELAFLVIFISLLVWSFSAYIHGMFANITRKSASQMGDQVWEVKLDSAALMLGLVGNICLASLFFPVTRGSSVLRLIGLTSEWSIKYDIWLGHAVMTLFTAHGLCYIIFWVNTHQIANEIHVNHDIGMIRVTRTLNDLICANADAEMGQSWDLKCGWRISLGFWFSRVGDELSWHQEKAFELFFYTHHLYIFFLAFFILHVGFSYCWITLPGFYLFLVDRCLRFLQSQQRVRLFSAHLLPCQAVELNFSKSPGLGYNPTSTIFINVPAISKLQWHPFTITSSSNMDPEKLSVVIKSEGSWSHRLYEKLALPMERLEVSLEGPYGPASTHFLRHDTLVMVSGGSGVTPFISIICELLFTSGTTSFKTPRLLLVTVFKKSVDLNMLDLLLPVSGTICDFSKLRLQIEAYVTRENGPTRDGQKPHMTVWFKPSTSDAPVSASLGSNSWLWLGAIIVSSTVGFLLLVSVLTRFYIYPIDHNSNMTF